MYGQCMEWQTPEKRKRTHRYGPLHIVRHPTQGRRVRNSRRRITILQKVRRRMCGRACGIVLTLALLGTVLVLVHWVWPPATVPLLTFFIRR